MDGQIVIPVSGTASVAILAGLVTLVAIAMLSGLHGAVLGERGWRRWSDLNRARQAVAAITLAIWAVLALVAILAALLGALRMVALLPATSAADPTGAGGLGALLAFVPGAPFLVRATLIRQRTVDIAQEGHMTDRIAKAVAQLGAEKSVKRDGREETLPDIEVRIGAILALERIAQDSTSLDHGRDHVRVMEILCAYIRHDAPASSAAELPSEVPAAESRRLTAPMMTGLNLRPGPWRNPTGARSRASTLPQPRADVALALDVIGRKSLERKQIEARHRAHRVDARWPLSADPPMPPEAPARARAGADAEGLPNAVRENLRRDPGTLAHDRYQRDLRECHLLRADVTRGDFSAARRAARAAPTRARPAPAPR